MALTAPSPPTILTKGVDPTTTPLDQHGRVARPPDTDPGKMVYVAGLTLGQGGYLAARVDLDDLSAVSRRRALAVAPMTRWRPALSMTAARRSTAGSRISSSSSVCSTAPRIEEPRTVCV